MPTALLDTSVKSFEQAFHFNVTTAFALSKAAIPHMFATGSGSIINISSAMGRLRDRGFAAYGTAKAGLAHLTRLMAADCAPRIRVRRSRSVRSLRLRSRSTAASKPPTSIWDFLICRRPYTRSSPASVAQPDRASHF